MKWHNRSGVILYVVLWSLVILSMLAIGMSRRTSVDLALTKYEIAKLKAKYIAWAGVIYAMDLTRQDMADEESQDRDNLYYCAIPINTRWTTKDLFYEQTVGQGYFTVQAGQEAYGLTDEERLLNINALDARSVAVLEELLILLEVDDALAKNIASAILDWTDSNDVSADDEFEAEDTYYQSLTNPYHCKNRPFDALEELLLVRGMTDDIFRQLKPFVTIFPKKSLTLKVNFDTAPDFVLRALARSLAGYGSNTRNVDADALVTKMINYRNGDDGEPSTMDDRFIDASALSLNAKEKALINTMNAYRTKQSKYVRVVSKGYENQRDIAFQIEAVFRRSDLSVVYWSQS